MKTGRGTPVRRAFQLCVLPVCRRIDIVITYLNINHLESSAREDEESQLQGVRLAAFIFNGL